MNRVPFLGLIAGLTSLTAGFYWASTEGSAGLPPAALVDQVPPARAQQGATPPLHARTDRNSVAAQEITAAPGDDHTESESPVDGTPVGDNPAYPTLEMRLSEMQARRDGYAFDPQQVLKAMGEPAAWTTDDGVAEQLALTDEERYDGRSFIRFNPLKIETLMPGDRLEIPIQQENAIYQMQVERVQSHGDGTITWHGHLQDFQGENQVSITQSQGLTSISLITPEEPYVVQAHGAAGFVVSSGTLFKGHDITIEVSSHVHDGSLAGHGEAEPTLSTHSH